MNDWGIPADDDINPLGPTPTGLDTEPAERGEAVEEFTDGTGSVTLGVDDDGVIVAIRIKNNWQDSGRGHKLELLVSSAALNLRVELPPLDGPQVIRPTMPVIEPRRLLQADYFDAHEAQRLVDGLNELTRPVDVEAPGFRDEVDFIPAVGTSTNRKITVTLGVGRLFQSCTIDDEWSEGARAEKIMETFMEAHDRALASYSEPVVIPGRGRARVQQAQDMAQLTLSLLAGQDRRDREEPSDRAE